MSVRDVRALPYMPLFVVKLLGSVTWLMATGDEAKAAVNLWARSWHELPAGTLPNDERALAALSGAGAKWRKVRDIALRGFELGPDGRLHHEVIEEAADDALVRLVGNQTRAAKARAALKEKRDALRLQRDKDCDSHRDSHSHRSTREREREREREQKAPPVASLPAVQGGLPPPLDPPVRRQKPPPVDTRPTWSAYSTAYLARYSVDPVRNARVNSLLAELVRRLGVTAAPMVAAHYLRSNRGLYVAARHAPQLLVRDAESLHTEWATGNTMTDAQARQADRTAATGAVFSELIREGRNGTEG